jgi:molecular chaperone GrpE
MTDDDKILSAAEGVTEAANDTIEVADDALVALQAEAKNWQEKAYRAAAELENFRKRTQAEVAEARLYAAQSFAKDVLSVADNLSRALNAPEGEGLRKGVELTASQFTTILQRHGITKTEVKEGEPLNPELHQAMTEVESNNPAGTIVNELQAGYTLHGRLLRPALVSVAKAKTYSEVENIIKFWPMFEERILNGWKVQSRRRGQRAYKVGMVLHAHNNESGIHFADLKITRVWQQSYNQMSDDEGYKDGFQNKVEFWETFQKIYPGVPADEQFTAVEFEIVK